MSKYQRQHDGKTKPRDKRVKASLKRLDAQYGDAMKAIQDTEVLLQESTGLLEAESEMEKTFKVDQNEILESVDVAVQKKAIDLKLDSYGSYVFDYSRNGRSLLIGGHKGHVASMDWQYGTLSCELNLGESVYAVKNLHNDQFFAVAQKKYTFIYDKTGVEIHRLKQHIEARHLEFLPYHFLLVTAGNTGVLRYQDVSTGSLVSEIRTKLGPTISMSQNPWNAVIHCGHSNGQVSLWSPAVSRPLVKVLATRGPVRSISVNRDGNYMACTGADKTVKVWDIRMFKELSSFETPTPASSCSFSDSGLLSVSFGPHVNVYRKVKVNSELYMHHLNTGSKIETAKFVPFEDLLCLGHEKGIKNIVVPGSGEANFDSLEINPFESTKQRQENEVRMLMNKLAPDMITLDPNVIGTIEKQANTARLSAKDLALLEEKRAGSKTNDEKMAILPKVKGKNSSLRRYMRKKSKNVIDERRLRVENNLKREKELRKKIHSKIQEKEDDLPALSRFK